MVPRVKLKLVRPLNPPTQGPDWRRQSGHLPPPTQTRRHQEDEGWQVRLFLTLLRPLLLARTIVLLLLLLLLWAVQSSSTLRPRRHRM